MGRRTDADGRSTTRQRNGPFERRDRIILQHLSGLSEDARVLDIGAGVFRRVELTGSQRLITTDIRSLPDVDFVADAAALPLADGSLDAVLMLEVLEHVPHPQRLLTEVNRVLAPGGVVMVSVPSTVPRHSDTDYWRFTAQGLSQLCDAEFADGEIHVLGGTFEALAYLAGYYASLVAHQVRLPARRLSDALMSAGYRLDSMNRWSSSSTELHTLAFDVFYVGRAGPAPTSSAPGAPRASGRTGPGSQR